MTPSATADAETAPTKRTPVGNQKGHRRRFGQIQKLPSGRFRARYTGPDGTLYNAPTTFGSRGDADLWLSNESSRISRGVWRSPQQAAAEERARARKGVTLGDYATEALGRRKFRPTTREATERLLRRCILPTFGKTALTAVTTQQVNRWYATMAATPSQQANAYGLLKSILKDAVDDELLTRNPCRVRGGSTKTRAREPIALTAGQLTGYLAAIPNENHRTALMLAAWCALRSGEVRGLRRKDVDLAAGTLRIEQQAVKVGSRHVLATPKTSAGIRTVAMPPHITPILRDWLARQPMRGADGLLFAAPDGVSPLSQQTLRDAHVIGRDAIGATGLTIHGLRHTGLTLAAQAGATVAELQARAGHTTASMALRYQHAAQERDVALAARMAALSAL